ncbi:hypothetical protein D4R87_02860 [bacterium]|nr:MAG: hypothetical protein D4R87_02860 [bacterium]
MERLIEKLNVGKTSIFGLLATFILVGYYLEMKTDTKIWGHIFLGVSLLIFIFLCLFFVLNSVYCFSIEHKNSLIKELSLTIEKRDQTIESYRDNELLRQDMEFKRQTQIDQKTTFSDQYESELKGDETLSK